jgi:hypothetical protein
MVKLYSASEFFNIILLKDIIPLNIPKSLKSLGGYKKDTIVIVTPHHLYIKPFGKIQTIEGHIYKDFKTKETVKLSDLTEGVDYAKI